MQRNEQPAASCERVLTQVIDLAEEELTGAGASLQLPAGAAKPAAASAGAKLREQRSLEQTLEHLEIVK